MPSNNLKFRKPNANDGVAIHQLIEQSPPLDLNSTYLYLLQSTHFAETCIVAEVDDRVAAFLSGYIKPDSPTTFFLWQVAVGELLRGQGMAKRLINEVLKREACRQVKFLETTITPDNQASWGLFRSFAKERSAQLVEEVLFTSQQLGGEHLEEVLVKIGPFS